MEIKYLFFLLQGTAARELRHRPVASSTGPKCVVRRYRDVCSIARGGFSVCCMDKSRTAVHVI